MRLQDGLVDALALKAYRCAEATTETLVFVPLQPARFPLNGVPSPIDSAADTIEIRLGVGMATIAGPAGRRLLVDELARLLQARSA